MNHSIKPLLTLTLLLTPTLCMGQTVTADRVGINTPLPNVPLEFTVRYPAHTTASEELIRFTTPTGIHNGVTHHPYQFVQRSTVFGNDRTDSVGWGFMPAGDPQASPSLGFWMEDYFGNNFELHLQLATPAGASRPWTWTFDRTTGKAVLVTSASSSFYGGGWLVSGKPELHIGEVETLSMGPLRQQSDSVKFETTANGGTHHKQIRIVPHPNDAGLSRLVFGTVENGVSLSNPNNSELEITRAGLPAPVNAGQYKVDGMKVVGAQCAAIPDPRFDKFSNETLIMILECLRSHGLVAQ